MTSQIIFIGLLVLTFAVFIYSCIRYYKLFKLTKPAFKVKNIPKRIALVFDVAIFQSKIFRRPIIGLFHALVFWGFIIILFGSLEMVVDGIAGIERAFSGLGVLYDFLIAAGDIFAFIIAIAIIIFLFRRVFLNVKRFEGIEMKKKSHMDANLALTIILLLMISLLGMNTFYIIIGGKEGIYPASDVFSGLFKNIDSNTAHLIYEANWWSHIVLIFLFANILPYSKHFHVFMSVPNVFLSDLKPLGKLKNMENITKEVKLMMDEQAAFEEPPEEDDEEVQRFGVLDAEDVNWKNYMDSLSCTQCGRCTAACPANITGKKLSPRKIMIDLRDRMKEKGPKLTKNRNFSDEKALIRSYISEEELWACTTCNACAVECPININHPALIIDMRRYLVMEESVAPAELNTMFSNIENNGAPWQFNQEDRLNWTENLNVNI